MRHEDYHEFNVDDRMCYTVSDRPECAAIAIGAASLIEPPYDLPKPTKATLGARKAVPTQEHQP